MASNGQLVGTVTYGDYKAEVFSTNLPGEFRVAYQNGGGETLEEAPLTGISSYRQRESEISTRLKELAEGAPVPATLTKATRASTDAQEAVTLAHQYVSPVW